MVLQVYVEPLRGGEEKVKNEVAYRLEKCELKEYR